MIMQVGAELEKFGMEAAKADDQAVGRRSIRSTGPKSMTFPPKR